MIVWQFHSFLIFNRLVKRILLKPAKKVLKQALWLCPTNAFYAEKHIRHQQLLCYGGQFAIRKNGCYGCSCRDIGCTTDRLAVTQR